MRDSLANLKVKMGAIEGRHCRGTGGVVPLRTSAVDFVLGGGLSRGAMHEVFASRQTDASTACGFGLVLALQAAGVRPVVWARHDYAASEAGGLHAPGLVELGFDPARLIMVCARSSIDALRAGAEATACRALGAVMIEVWGDPAVVDLTATRRLSIAAAASGVTLMMIRTGARPAPSAASTRWSVKTAVSTPFEANAPGRPAFDITLQRSRNGVSGHRWILEWDRDRRAFEDAKTMAGCVASVAGDGPPAAAERGSEWRQAG